MAKYGASDLKFFEQGYLLIGTKIVLGLNNISLSYNVDTDELLTFDLNKVKGVYPTFGSWTASAQGQALTLTSDTYSPLSADTRVTGATNAYTLLESIKAKVELPIVLKIDTANYQTSTCILTSYELSADAGSALTFSIELTGTGDLQKQTS